MIYKEITKSAFMDEFHNMGRKSQFSYLALSALYDFLEELYEGSGEHYELDVIALCCDYSEFTLDELRAEYSRPSREDESDEQMIEYFNDHTTVIMIDDSTVIIGSF